ACAVGPDYKAPVTVPAQLASAAQGNYDRSKVDTVWWQQFEDPTLNKLVARSLDGNRDLRVAFARLKAARAIRDDVANDAMPVIT
ncbi:outer membrane efflux protein, partial [Pseudomonas savastanoi pv. glycinea str. race 4]